MMVEFLVVLAAVLTTAQSVQAHGVQLAECILQQPPFAPRDVNLFTPQTYPEASTPSPAPPRTVSERQLRSLVRSTLNERFHGNQRKVAQGLAVFDSSEIAEIVPDPRLRAGLALLLGTAGEAAMAWSRLPTASAPLPLPAAAHARRSASNSTGVERRRAPLT